MKGIIIFNIHDNTLHWCQVWHKLIKIFNVEIFCKKNCWYVWKCIKCVFFILVFHSRMYHLTSKFGGHLTNQIRHYLKPSSKYIKWKMKLFFLYLHLFKCINYAFEIERTYNCLKCSLLYMNKNSLNPLDSFLFLLLISFMTS